MKIYLLTHERELDRPTNTGAIALSVAGGAGGVVERRVWSRTQPDTELVRLLGSGAAALLYPRSEALGEIAGGREVEPKACEYLVVLDATWQEARKMYNRSPYLKSAPRVNLHPSNASRFRLRRNQKPDGLCTAECVVEILHDKGYEELAAEIERAFIDFNDRRR